MKSAVLLSLNSCIMSSVALEGSWCHQGYLESSLRLQNIWQKTCIINCRYEVLKMRVFNRQGRSNERCYRVALSSIFEVWPTLGTKNQNISASSATILIILFFSCLSQLHQLCVCDIKYRCSLPLRLIGRKVQSHTLTAICQCASCVISC